MRELYRMVLLVVVCCTHLAGAAGLEIRVRNNKYERRDLVVAQPVTWEWALKHGTGVMCERLADGTLVAVSSALDRSGSEPVLIWILPGTTAPGSSRNFVWSQGVHAAAARSDLSLAMSRTEITISNSFFNLSHPLKGKGGFPQQIGYTRSGNRDHELFFMDRIVRDGREGGLVQYHARDCDDAVAEVVAASPLRIVVETQGGFGKRSANAPGEPRVRYRYTYSAYSPVVEVEAHYERSDTTFWRELHFLHLTRREAHYKRFVAGDMEELRDFQPAGETSRSMSAPQWAVMDDSSDACGVGFDGAVCWDASSAFVYYIRSGHMQWSDSTAHFEGGLYFGPSGTHEWYSQWLGSERMPEITLYRDGQRWLALEQAELSGDFELQNDALRLVFAGPEQGFDCLGIENRLVDDTRFVQTRDGVAGLWSLTFRSQTGSDSVMESVALSNHTPARRCYAVSKRGRLTFVWEGLDLPGEPGVVDVHAEVVLKPGTGESLWQIKVKNRSQRFGLWESSYPLLSGVVPRGRGDVLLPTGNWGGRLMRRHGGRWQAGYPSASCPLQMMAFNLGDAGLYFAAHDGRAVTKRLSIQPTQDATFHVMAEDAGVVGRAGAPSYPVVIAAYRGDWWQAAQRYRQWATGQLWCARGPLAVRRDYPARLKELGFWMICSGEPQSVTNQMALAAKLFPGVPVGVHWYNWHQIPFDHTYPEYFPTKPGVAEAARAMAAEGQTVMPYINARLWDEEIPSFAAAFGATAKQTTGTNYVEIYGSKRKLVPMCPATKLWQERVGEICQRLMDECGVNAIYLDQIGAARPAQCFDPAHGHPLGGGHHWTDGYRTMMAPIKREAARRNIILTTENTAEPYMDTIDAYLTWNPRVEEDVPLLPAVYSGYTTYFSSPQGAEDTLDAFCAGQARDFLWGCQLGWNSQWILEPDHREKQQFQYELCRYRLAAAEFMVDGQLVDEVRPLKDVPLVSHRWHYRNPHQAHLPAVMGSIWRDAARRQLALFVVNPGSEPRQCEIAVAPEQWLTGRRGAWQVAELTPAGLSELGMLQDGQLYMADLAPRTIRVVVIR